MIILNVIQHKSLHTSYLHQFFCRKVESYHSTHYIPSNYVVYEVNHKSLGPYWY